MFNGRLPDPPDYHVMWHEVRGYVQEAVEDARGMDPAYMLDYMTELHKRCRVPEDQGVCELLARFRMARKRTGLRNALIHIGAYTLAGWADILADLGQEPREFEAGE